MRLIGGIILAASLTGLLTGCEDDALHAYYRKRNPGRNVAVQRAAPAGDYGAPGETPPSEYLPDYLPDREAEWVTDAISWSRRNRDYAIVIDKKEYSLTVYKDGQAIAEFPVELGSDPIDPKKRENDGRTPEGVYDKCWWNPQTKHYRSLLLNYPNAEDEADGRTGSDIAIHGDGHGLRGNAGGRNWTDGCVALSDEDIDRVYSLRDGAKRVGNGTPVVIVYGATGGTPVTSR